MRRERLLSVQPTGNCINAKKPPRVRAETGCAISLQPSPVEGLAEPVGVSQIGARSEFDEVGSGRALDVLPSVDVNQSSQLHHRVTNPRNEAL